MSLSNSWVAVARRDDGAFLIVHKEDLGDAMASAAILNNGRVSGLQPLQVYFKWNVWEDLDTPTPISELGVL